MGLFGKGFSGQKLLDFALGGYAGLDRRNAMETQAKYQAQIDATGTPQEKIAYAFAPKKLGEAYADRFSSHNVGAGDLLINGPNGNVYNPKTSFEGQYMYRTRPDGTQELVGERPKTYQETTAIYNATKPDNVPVQAGGSVYSVPRPAYPGEGAPTVPLPQSAPMTPQGDVGSAAESMIGQLGGTITSRGRSPEKNASVGGVANSMHLDNMARDFVPPPGADRKAIVAQFKADPRFTEVLDEGDHIHVGWRPKGGQTVAPPMLQGATDGQPRMIIQGPAKPMTRIATPAEKAAAGIPDNLPAQVKPDGSIDVIQGAGAGQKQVPAVASAAYNGNVASLMDLDDAIKLVEANRDSFGLMRAAGNLINSRVDPKGTAARAAVANMSSVKRHDISGAAVSPAEDKYLQPLVVTPTDNAETALTKLRQYRQQIVNANSAIEATYNAENGYRPLGGQAEPAQTTAPVAPPKKPIPGPKVGTIDGGYRFKGGDPASPSSWVKVN